MCGICGGLNVVPDGRPTEALIRRMNDTLTHRGPDGEGVFFEAVDGTSVGLGHRRLSILDLSDVGRQPMTDEARRAYITYNGEVYNHRELRSRLQGLGHSFRSRTDTEVVLKAYLEWGVNCLDYLEGMFAFCIWDRVNQRAFLARDRIGIKPLYYSVSDQYLTFASELKALIQDPSFPRTVDTAAVDAYVSFGYIPAPRSIFEHARKLLPAHYLIWDHGNVTINRYWSYDPAVEEPDPGLDTWLNRLRDTLQASVPAQMVSDVPVGALLSGGIDSSLVVRMMASGSAAVTTSSMGFGIDSFDELPYARMVAKQFGTDHSEHRISPDLMGILPKLAWHLDEPFGDSSIVPTYYVCKAIRESVKVALSGDGGDELFAGYTRYQGEQFSKLFAGLPLFLRNLIGATSRRIPPDWSAGLRRMKRVLSSTELSFLDRYLAKGALCDTATKQRLLGGLSDHSDDSRGALEGIVASNDDFVQNLIRLDLEFYLPNDMLMKVDKMSMASSLEVRVPLLDESVVALAAQMPTRHKLRGFQTKYILRKLSEESLPPQITRRKKQGFGMPVQDWFRGDLREMARDLLSTTSHFEQNTVETVLDEHHRQVEDHGHLIFALLMFELWHKAFAE